jgi:CubicO group peptidase (beta-lactamase class C family)
MLVDESRLQLDTPIREYLPGFRLYDQVATEEITTRDLLTHRSGLPRHDAIASTSDFTREDLVRRLQYLQPSKPFRSTYQYSNLMYMTAGYLAGKINGTTWEEAVQQRIIAPLHLTNTNFSVLDSQKGKDFSQPYEQDYDTGEVTRVPFRVEGATGPAGGINSSVIDMGQYLLLHMNLGKFEGKQLLSENTAIQMQTPQITVPDEPLFKELGPLTYGLGFDLLTYRGHRIVEHGGNVPGFTAIFVFLPDDHAGVVVLCNLGQAFLPQIVAFNVLDRFIGGEQLPWNQRLLDRDRHYRQSEKEAKSKGYTQPKSGTHPSHDLNDYTGEYENPGYGIVSITREGDGFQMRLNRQTESLLHYHYDIFKTPDNALDIFPNLKVAFQTNSDGDVASLSAPLEPTVADIVFTRKPDKQLTDRDFLETLVGRYDMPGETQPLTISLHGDHTLVASLPGEPGYELIPTRGTTFKFAGHGSFSIEFKKDSTGKITEAAYDRVDTVLILKKRP